MFNKGKKCIYSWAVLCQENDCRECWIHLESTGKARRDTVATTSRPVLDNKDSGKGTS